MGYGQVGQALGKIIGPHLYYDSNWRSITKEKVSVLHICYPFSKNFVQSVRKYIDIFNPELTIIHSTVAVGTTRKIDRKCVYSFVRGRHPDLTEMVRFTKHLGCTDKHRLALADEYLQKKGFATQLHDKPETVELGKLFDTTYYGVCIALTKEAKKWADHYAIDYNEIQKINITYNCGWQRCGHPEFVRPVLTPMPGKIGGHCVVPNAKILQKDFPDSKLIKSIIESE